MPKKRIKIKSKNYFVCIRAMSNKKDGEYYDITFGLKGQKNREMRAHYGVKAVTENGLIGGKIFFLKPRQITPHYSEKTFNMKTGELLAELDIPFRKDNGKIGAEIHISTYWDDKVQRLFIGKVEIIEKS